MPLDDRFLARYPKTSSPLQAAKRASIQRLRFGRGCDFSVNAWKALTLHLGGGAVARWRGGAVAMDNNLIERQIKPWKLGAKNWLFVGSELAKWAARVLRWS
ncbi:IS66 family transposase [Variovorax ginsengisoli]|uniref:Transposase n=1 Tax=Variovorax ginsengisoli TaxID=363844 RepID=A0ABT8SEN8_9BURK|nr:transposase [Variovorax ginsengisoli]MDN8618153.1 transposase [Variovorax ginsengisoli]MDO1537323.1 transposase [Variovorax ginsengisoli]